MGGKYKIMFIGKNIKIEDDSNITINEGSYIDGISIDIYLYNNKKYIIYNNKYITFNRGIFNITNIIDSYCLYIDDIRDSNIKKIKNDYMYLNYEFNKTILVLLIYNKDIDSNIKTIDGRNIKYCNKIRFIDYLDYKLVNVNNVYMLSKNYNECKITIDDELYIMINSKAITTYYINSKYILDKHVPIVIHIVNNTEYILKLYITNLYIMIKDYNIEYIDDIDKASRIILL